MNDKIQYLNEYTKIRQNAFKLAYEEGFFSASEGKCLTEEEDNCLKKYISSESDYATISCLEEDGIMGNIFSKYVVDTNWLINNYGDMELNEDFHAGYLLYWYGEDAYRMSLHQNGRNSISTKLKKCFSKRIY